MEHAFEIYTPDGKTVERYPYVQDKQTLQDGILDRVASEPWYRVRYHECYNIARRPCKPWQVVAEHGDVPDDETAD